MKKRAYLPETLALATVLLVQIRLNALPLFDLVCVCERKNDASVDVNRLVRASSSSGTAMQRYAIGSALSS